VKEKQQMLESLIITEQLLQHRAMVLAGLTKTPNVDAEDDDEDEPDTHATMTSSSHTRRRNRITRHHNNNSSSVSTALSNSVPGRDDISQAQAILSTIMNEQQKDLANFKDLIALLRDALNGRLNAAHNLPLPTSSPSSSTASSLGSLITYKIPSETILTELRSVTEQVSDLKTKTEMQSATQQLSDLIASCDKERAVVFSNFEVLYSHLLTSFVKYLEIPSK
jgi:hypothetical protein